MVLMALRDAAVARFAGPFLTPLPQSLAPARGNRCQVCCCAILYTLRSGLSAYCSSRSVSNGTEFHPGGTLSLCTAWGHISLSSRGPQEGFHGGQGL